MAYFEYQSKKVFYQEIGSGKPLIFLHGNTASSRMFTEVIKGYTDYKVVLIDFLGYGQSERVEKLPIDLWYDEAQQVIAFLEQKQYHEVSLIGSSGGALAAINVALEKPEWIDQVIADSFEGEESRAELTTHIVQNRAASKQMPGAVMFYQAMLGEDWEVVVDQDTEAIDKHARTIGKFFHKPLEDFKPDILMIGSKEDEFMMSPGFYSHIYEEMIRKIGHGRYYVFEHGGHPAMLSNAEAFIQLSLEFLK